MTTTTQDDGSGREPSLLQRSTFRAFAALAFTGAITLPVVGIAAAQSGSLGSSGSGGPSSPARTSTVELRVLVLDDGAPAVGALASRLTAEGVEVDRVDVSREGASRITREMLADDAAARAHYMGIVSPSANRGAITSDEHRVLDAFAADYGIREIAAYNWPGPAIGMETPTYSGEVDGMRVRLTPAATGGEWSYLDGPLTFDDLAPGLEAYGYVSNPVADPGAASFRPLLTTPDHGGGALMGVYTTDGREQLVLTVDMNEYQQQFKVLSHGMISWLTRGVSTSLYRNTFNVQIDDVFLADDEWNPEGNCTFGAGCADEPDAGDLAESRMDAGDVQAATGWEDANDVELDMTYNAFGATDGDALTRSLLAVKDKHRWINHTWDHTNLDNLDQAGITAQIRDNLDWARDNGVDVDPSELVTGQHSGLISGPARQDNPALAPALNATGVTWIAADASVEADQRQVGGALTVPRHPMNIFYNTSTKYNAVDEYNWIYTSATAGGSGICDANPAATCITPLDPETGFDSYIVPQEARHALNHALGMDPRPHYVHQSNLAGDRILYPVLDRLLGDYRALFADSAPLANPTHAQLGQEMQRRAAWAAAATSVTATVTGSTLVITNNGGSAVDVPVTTPDGSSLAGSSYAGARSGWVPVGAGGSVTIDLGGDAGFRTPTGDAPEPAVAARSVPQTARANSPAPGQQSVVIPPVNEATRVGAMGEGPSAIG